MEPVLRYALPIWGGCADCYLQPIRVLQHRAVKTLVGLDRYSSATEAFQKAKVPALNDILKVETCRLVGKMGGTVGRREMRSGLRRAGEMWLRVPNWIKAHSQAQFGFRGPQMYNSLLATIRGIANGRLRDRAIKKYLLQ